jgi:hypothetical protein
MKIPVVNREYYIIYIEYFNDMHWLHTDVFKWSPEIKKQYVKDLDTLQGLIDCKLYGMVEDYNNKLGKFGESIGFNYFKDLKGNDGNVYKIYTRSL